MLSKHIRAQHDNEVTTESPSQAAIDHEGRAVRKRARVACDSCRRKKVRCKCSADQRLHWGGLETPLGGGTTAGVIQQDRLSETVSGSILIPPISLDLGTLQPGSMGARGEEGGSDGASHDLDLWSGLDMTGFPEWVSINSIQTFED